MEFIRRKWGGGPHFQGVLNAKVYDTGRGTTVDGLSRAYCYTVNIMCTKRSGPYLYCCLTLASGQQP